MPHFSISPTLRTWVEINLDALRHNFGVVRRRVGPRPSILPVIKANAYGHGIVPIARALAHDVSVFGVANLSEAREVASAQTGRDVMLLSPALPSERREASAENFIVTVSSASEAAAFAACGRTRINFKVDTGMGRVGAWWERALGEVEQIARMPKIEFYSISTHLPSADDDPKFTENQLTHFAQLINAYRRSVPGIKIHSLNSAGILRFPEYAVDIVRAGLVLYGSSPLPEWQHELIPVLSWKTRVMLIRELPAGAGISYGRTFITQCPTRIALLALGYADGYPWQASGQGASVLIRGKKCPVLGRISMDQIVADITNVVNIEEGDEVVLIGRQNQEEILVAELAAKAGTIAWDILTGLGGRVARIYPE